MKRHAAKRPANQDAGNNPPVIAGNRLTYPLPSRPCPGSLWTIPAILSSLAAGGWFSASSDYHFLSKREADYARLAQAFFSELFKGA